MTVCFLIFRAIDVLKKMSKKYNKKSFYKNPPLRCYKLWYEKKQQWKRCLLYNFTQLQQYTSWWITDMTHILILRFTEPFSLWFLWLLIKKIVYYTDFYWHKVTNPKIIILFCHAVYLFIRHNAHKEMFWCSLGINMEVKIIYRHKHTHTHTARPCKLLKHFLHATLLSMKALYCSRWHSESA